MTMKKITSYITHYSVLLLMLLPAVSVAQDEPAAPVKKEFVRNTFEYGIVINNPTIEAPRKKSLDFVIQHRFGKIKDEKDLFGLYASANIRMGLGYGITDRLSIGVGATKRNMTYDFEAKYAILRQTKGSGCPVSVTYLGSISKSSTANDNFLNSDGEYKPAYKYTYFHELMIARKITSKLSLQVAGTYSHFNIIDSIYQQHDFIGASMVGRYKFSPQSSIIVDFDYLVNAPDVDDAIKAKPNLSIGYEVSTGSHQFQIFFSTADAILEHDNVVFNTNDFTKREFLIGFNISRNWGF
jgi:Membrane bound beta barrel domain (DUF5777)